MNGALLLHPLFHQHNTGPGHPECPARYDAITSALTRAGWPSSLTPIELRRATPDELLRVHTRRYLDTVAADVAAGLDTLSTGDTALCDRSLIVAESAVGGCLNAVDLIMTGATRRAFCAVRPPGHHARPSQGMGFCLFNTIALAARHAQAVHGAEKVAIIDWDVHHGNGTQDTFYADPSVFFFSCHQSPWYPFTGHAAETGEGKGRHTTLNFPLPAGSGIHAIGPAFTDHLLPALDAFQPHLVLISAGFDSRLGDPLGQFTLTDPDFASLTRHLIDIANRHADGRLISILEGGYHLTGLADAVTAHVDALFAD